MNIGRFHKKAIRSLAVLFFLLAMCSKQTPGVRAQGGYDPTVQTPALLYDEARTVYLGNLARRDNGVPPLRWNLQLTHAARWFSWDSTENRPSGFCGHQDTQGQWPDYRALAFGYLGSAGWENAFCGYVTPEDAIAGWMNSSGHRANLLNPSLREIGLGYYRRDSDGRGYVTQDFGSDAVYAPVIIENEAISTTNPSVNLYIYDRSTSGGFAGLAAATQMMVSNNDHFSGGSWEPYSANKIWTLTTGEGWRNVFVKTRDRFNRSLTASDSIYLGANVPLNELGAAQMSATWSQVTLYDLDGGSLPQVQFSPGWLADDTSDSFSKWWGNGERVTDAAAWGGTAYRLYPGNGESFAWVNDWTFIKGVPMVAYFRLKVNDNTSSSEVARISVKGGGTEYGPLSLRGTDFNAPNQYQEFALNFTFNTNPSDAFLTFNFWRSGSADLYVDAVSIFSTPQAITSPLTWTVPGNNYRGQGIWVRYTNGSQFSNISDAATVPSSYPLNVSKSGNGSGTVTSNPSGINCGSDCSETYAFNTSVTLSAAPAVGSNFVGWSGGGCSGTGDCTVTMTAAITVTARFVQPPGKVALVSPLGAIDSTQPTFVWNVDSLATWYYLRARRSDGSVVFTQWYQADSVCSGSICSTRSPNPLAGGDHIWDVQTWNEGGYGPWSDPFSITAPFKPGTASLRAPAGAITPSQLVFSWDISLDDATTDPATWYYLWINGPSGKVLNQWYEASAICSGITCSVTPNLSLASGSYTWWVQTWNVAGTGPWSAAMMFNLSPVPAVTPISPNSNIGANYNPTYTWSAASDATWYYLWVNGPSGNVIKKWYTSADANCNASTCSVTPATTLGGGNHTWWVQTWNPAGTGPWSSGMSFTTIPLGAATLVSPIGSINANYTPTYTWNEVAGATWYYLWVNGPSGNVIQQWFTAADANCNGTTCSVTPAKTLNGGNHTWWIQTWNAGGLGPWSAGMSFTTTPLGAVALVSPSGSTANHTPTYTWNVVPGATWYYLWVNGPSGVVIQKWYTSADANCTALTCSVTPVTNLNSGNHTWWIQTWNSAGTGPWSSAKNFIVTP